MSTPGLKRPASSNINSARKESDLSRLQRSTGNGRRVPGSATTNRTKSTFGSSSSSSSSTRTSSARTTTSSVNASRLGRKVPAAVSDLERLAKGRDAGTRATVSSANRNASTARREAMARSRTTATNSARTTATNSARTPSSARTPVTSAASRGPYSQARLKPASARRPLSGASSAGTTTTTRTGTRPTQLRGPSSGASRFGFRG
eukprot:TRINITY_DN446_c0_g2_i3.p1 TRINITY_DN446_c0_g2~~TRINITY_DN446_c0_g2_i3.p1  ORF type:complete len:205 (-),score=61.92 TRINITY_DN446_c0_g2_i3:584-1198(-)